MWFTKLEYFFIKHLWNLFKDPESDEEIDMKNELAGENIKEICDVSSGMSSSVMQLFLKQVNIHFDIY